jgi:hypothetical protein
MVAPEYNDDDDDDDDGMEPSGSKGGQQVQACTSSTNVVHNSKNCNVTTTAALRTRRGIIPYRSIRGLLEEMDV